MDGHDCVDMEDPEAVKPMQIAPGLSCPALDQNFEFYENYVEDNFPVEGPVLFGLHSNAEIGFLLATSDSVFSTIIEIGGVGGGLSAGTGDGDSGGRLVQEFTERLPVEF